MKETRSQYNYGENTYFGNFKLLIAHHSCIFKMHTRLSEKEMQRPQSVVLRKRHLNFFLVNTKKILLILCNDISLNSLLINV